MAPVWEANHVWLIFVLDRLLDRVPDRLRIDRLDAVGPAVPGRDRHHPARRRLRPARGHAAAASPARSTRYSRSPRSSPRSRSARRSARSPRRVPVGNAAGHLFSSWLVPPRSWWARWRLSARRLPGGRLPGGRRRETGEPRARAGFRVRALLAGLVAGALALPASWCCTRTPTRSTTALVTARGCRR